MNYGTFEISVPACVLQKDKLNTAGNRGHISIFLNGIGLIEADLSVKDFRYSMQIEYGPGYMYTTGPDKIDLACNLENIKSIESESETRPSQDFPFARQCSPIKAEAPLVRQLVDS